MGGSLLSVIGEWVDLCTCTVQRGTYFAGWFITEPTYKEKKIVNLMLALHGTMDIFKYIMGL